MRERTIQLTQEQYRDAVRSCGEDVSAMGCRGCLMHPGGGHIVRVEIIPDPVALDTAKAAQVAERGLVVGWLAKKEG